MKKILYVAPLLCLMNCAGPQKYISWQKAQSDISDSNKHIQETKIKSDQSINLSNRLVEITEIKERQKTARAFSNNPDCDNDCEDKKIKGKYLKIDSNPNNKLVLEGMDVITSELVKLKNTIKGIDNNKHKYIQDNSIPPITINANGATGGITINVSSPGAVAKNDNSEKKSVPVKRLDNNLQLMPFVNPPKTALENAFDSIFGFGNNIVNAAKENAGIIGLSLIGYEQANKDTSYVNNEGRTQEYDYSNRSDNSTSYTTSE